MPTTKDSSEGLDAATIPPVVFRCDASVPTGAQGPPLAPQGRELRRNRLAMHKCLRVLEARSCMPVAEAIGPTVDLARDEEFVRLASTP
eukprot:6538008-Heterocapsa_arctica.AAC.1